VQIVQKGTVKSSMDIKKLAEETQEQVVRWRRELHQIPEIGNDLPLTSQYVQDRLKAMGVTFVTMVNGSGILATIEGTATNADVNSGTDSNTNIDSKSNANSDADLESDCSLSKTRKTIALRADMDGLPLLEESDVEFKSTNGNMHACGHDAHTAMLLGVAKILSENKTEFNGTVKLIFQPGEESVGGAEPMIAEGAIEGVDAVFGLHLGCLFNDINESGKIIISHSNVMACRDSFKIKVIGRGAHGAFPENSIDPIAVGVQVINGIYMIKAREISALDPAVVSIGMVHSGTASNIIPTNLEIEGTTRSINSETRTKIANRIEQVLKNTCEAYSATYEFDYKKGYDITINNPDMADLVVSAAQKLGYGDDVVPQTSASMGAEDMSFFLNEVPGAYFFLSSVSHQDGQVFGHHHPKFLLDESVFHKGVAMFVQIAQAYLD